MNQLNMFDDHRIARPSDPETSKEAARKIEPRLESARGQMLFMWRRMAGTANEVAAEAVKQFGGNPETYRKRKAELFRDGLIELVRVRKCNETGATAEVYRGVPPEEKSNA